jgi:hypothetical protein
VLNSFNSPYKFLCTQCEMEAYSYHRSWNLQGTSIMLVTTITGISLVVSRSNDELSQISNLRQRQNDTSPHESVQLLSARFLNDDTSIHTVPLPFATMPTREGSPSVPTGVWMRQINTLRQ